MGPSGGLNEIIALSKTKQRQVCLTESHFLAMNSTGEGRTDNAFCEGYVVEFPFKPSWEVLFTTIASLFFSIK